MKTPKVLNVMGDAEQRGCDCSRAGRLNHPHLSVELPFDYRKTRVTEMRRQL